MADGFDEVNVDPNVHKNVKVAEPIIVGETINKIIDKLPEEERGAASAELMTAVQEFLSDCRNALEAASTRDLARMRDAMVTEARAVTERKIAEMVKNAGPMNPDEMQKLVSQEYLRFPICVEYPSVGDDAVDYIEKNFTIREVPQAVEKRIVNVVMQQIVPALQKFQNVKFTQGASNSAKLEEVVKKVPEIFDMLSEVTSICLNPYGKDALVTKDWVQENVSSSRMFNIVQAQFMANRIRDFFSGAYRGSLGM